MPSTARQNKVKFGLENVYYAKITGYNETTQTYTYATPVHIPGAVKLTSDPEGSSEKAYADNGVYYTITTNTGYSGDFENMLIPDSFLIDILGQTRDETTGAIIESANDVPSEFALLFEIKGDVNKMRHVLYRCAAERPSSEASTTEETATPQTDTIPYTAMQRENDGNVKAKIGYIEGNTANNTAYNNWFTTVWEPTATTPEGGSNT